MRLVALLTAMLVSGAALAQKEIPIRFALDWRFEGPAAPFFVAIDKLANEVGAGVSEFLRDREQFVRTLRAVEHELELESSPRRSRRRTSA